MPPVYTPSPLARVLLWALPNKFQWRMTQVPSELLAKRLVGGAHLMETLWALMIFIVVGQLVRITLSGAANLQAILVLMGIAVASVGFYAFSCWALGFTPPISISSKVENACGLFSRSQRHRFRRLSYDLLEAWVGQEDTARLAQKVMREETVQVQGVSAPPRRL